MFRRFLYHFFWNFYDYLGTYLIGGMLVTFTFLGLFIVFSVVTQALSGILLQGSVGLLGIVVLVSLLSAGIAALFHFATLAARDEPARFHNFREGISILWRRCAVTLIVWGAAVAIAVANILFYLRIGPGMASSPARVVTVFAAMLFVWLLAGLLIYALPYFAAVARYGPATTWRESARKAFVLFAVAPFYWISVTLFLAVLSLLCIASVAGVVFVLPLFASSSGTALHIAVRYTEFLTQAREALGDGQSVSAYRVKAEELALEADARTPRRGFRELIRPWEM